MKKTDMPQYNSLDRDWKQAQCFLSAASPTPHGHLGLPGPLLHHFYGEQERRGVLSIQEVARGQMSMAVVGVEAAPAEQRQDPPGSREAEDKSAQPVHPKMPSSSGSRRGCKTDRLTREGDHCIPTSAPAKIILYLNR